MTSIRKIPGGDVILKINPPLPTVNQIHKNILLRSENHQKELAGKIEHTNLETAFGIIVSHEWRHLEQAKEILEIMRKTSTNILNLPCSSAKIRLNLVPVTAENDRVFAIIFANENFSKLDMAAQNTECTAV